jgi:folate-binding protein YgfZ
VLELDAGVADLPGWALIEIAGSHRERFIASQVTSDVAGLDVGKSQLSALLDRSGRLQAFFFVHKRERSLELLVPDTAAEACVERLKDHVIADDVAITRRKVGAMRLALGPAAAAAAPADDRFPVAGWGTRGFVTWGDVDTAWSELRPSDLETLRTLGGPPAWDREVRQGQLVNETVLLESAVSFSKGCYLGQETVNKVSSNRGAVRGTVTLEVVRTDPEGVDGSVVGLNFAVGEKKRAGEVLAAARRGDRSHLVASLHRDLLVVSRDLVCVFDDGRRVEAVIRPAPLQPPPSRNRMAGELTAAASAAFARDDSERAVELLEWAVRVDPSCADAHESLGVVLGRLGRHDEAIRRMHRLLEVDPSSVMAHSNLSLLFNQIGDKEQAEHHLAMSTRLTMGGAAEVPSRDPEAPVEDDRRRREEMFRKVLTIDPDDPLAHFGLGELAAERRRHREAVEHLERAVAADPHHSAAILALGSAHEALGDTVQARSVYERGVDVAAKRGDAASATKMQERLNVLAESAR